MAVKEIEALIKGGLLMTTWHPVPLRKFKSFEQYDDYRQDIKKVWDKYDQEWRKHGFSKPRLWESYYDKLENINQKWEKKLSTTQKKRGKWKVSNIS